MNERRRFWDGVELTCAIVGGLTVGVIIGLDREMVKLTLQHPEYYPILTGVRKLQLLPTLISALAAEAGIVIAYIKDGFSSSFRINRKQTP